MLELMPLVISLVQKKRRVVSQELVAIVPKSDVAPRQARNLGQSERLPAHVLALGRCTRHSNHHALRDVIPACLGCPWQSRLLHRARHRRCIGVHASPAAQEAPCDGRTWLCFQPSPRDFWTSAAELWQARPKCRGSCCTWPRRVPALLPETPATTPTQPQPPHVESLPQSEPNAGWLHPIQCGCERVNRVHCKQ